MPDLEDVPAEFGQKFLTKVLRIRQRTTLAKRLLQPTLKAVHWTLIGSIVLFGAGLIFQLWISVFQSGGTSSGLFVASVVDTTFAAVLVTFVSAVTLHAVFFPESPFETALSRVLRDAFFWLFTGGAPPQLNAPRATAARHFCELLSNCDSPLLLDVGAPALIECLEVINFNDVRSMVAVENAIVQVLTVGQSPNVKLNVVISVRRINMSECGI